MSGHVVLLGEGHLRQVLKTYADYHNRVRTHLALEKDAPFGRPVPPVGHVVAVRQPAGTYRLVTEEEEIPGLSFVAFRRTAMLLHLPALPTTSHTHQVVSVDPVEWAAIVEADGRD
jgi:hypothetical protein